jgi:nucleoside-diphosphate kinase
MSLNYTFSIIKPDAFNTGKAGKILGHLEAQGFSIKAARVVHMTKPQAEEFYGVHRGRPFFGELVAFMSSAPCMPLILVKDNAVHALRDVIGATDPAEAAEGTVRKLYAESKGKNAIHASDSDENAHRESRFFFAEVDAI